MFPFSSQTRMGLKGGDCGAILSAKRTRWPRDGARVWPQCRTNTHLADWPNGLKAILTIYAYSNCILDMQLFSICLYSEYTSMTDIPLYQDYYLPLVLFVF